MRLFKKDNRAINMFLTLLGFDYLCMGYQGEIWRFHYNIIQYKSYIILTLLLKWYIFVFFKGSQILKEEPKLILADITVLLS